MGNKRPTTYFCLLFVLLFIIITLSACNAAPESNLDDELKQRTRRIESVLCGSQAPSLNQYLKFEECNSFLKIVGKNVVDGCRDYLFGHMVNHEERLAAVCSMSDDQKRSLGKTKIRCILEKTRSSPLIRMLLPREEFFEGKKDRMEKVIACQESALGITQMPNLRSS